MSKSRVHKRKSHSGIKLDRAERIQRVLDLKCAGNSNRAIAQELNVDEGTIRRDFKVLTTLSEQKVNAVLAGAAVQPLLEEQKKIEAVACHRQRALQLLQQDRYSRQLSDVFLDWLDGWPLLPVDLRLIIQRVDPMTWKRAGNPLIAIPISAAGRAFESTKPKSPQPIEVYELIDWLADWSAEALIRLEPNPRIRDRAIERVAAVLESRTKIW